MLVGILLVLLLSLVLTPIVLRSYSCSYYKLGVYHPLEDSDSGESFEESERMASKIFKVGSVNFSIVIMMSLLTFVYSISILGIASSRVPSITIAAAVLALIMVFSIRVAALADVDFLEWGEKLFDRLLNFGFAFGMSLYFLSLLGVAFSLTEVSLLSLKLDLGISVEGRQAAILTSLVIVPPFLLAVVSEKFLEKTGVPDEKVCNEQGDGETSR